MLPRAPHIRRQAREPMDAAGLVAKHTVSPPRLLLVCIVAIVLSSCSRAQSQAQQRSGPSLDAIKKARELLRPLHKPLGKPQSGDWLSEHAESGQTFEQYLASNPITPTGVRSVIYIQPLGEFDKNQQRILSLTQEYLSLCYNRPVKSLDRLPLSVIPAKARRVHPTWGVQQILTTHVLDQVLPPRLPADAAALIALTSSDLWPGEGWNFVFGQASLRNRVGVWSIYRNGNPGGTDQEFRLCLRRTLKTASHELGHMFSIEHCTRYECNMCGSNNQQESDRLPLAFCPECAAKIWWATEANPADHYQKLSDFCRREGLKEDAEFFQRSLATLQAGKK